MQLPRPVIDQRKGFRALIRKPSVQLLLCATAVLQAAAVEAERGGPAVAGPPVLQPVVVSQPQDPGGFPAWQRRAVERESLRLAQQYMSKGFPVSPALATDIGMAAAEHGIELEMAFGLVKAESSFRNSATSHVGAVGLTQLMPRTAAWMEPGVTRRDLRDPETNLRVGFKYLRYLLDKYEGDEELALLAYNRGPGTVDRVLRRGGNPNNGYVEMVLGE